MKVVLYMAQTINGMIAREDYGEDFFTEESWNVFLRFAEKIGCYSIGRKTYELYEKKNDPKYNFSKVKAKLIVVSRNPRLKVRKGQILARSPKDAVGKASALGLRKLMVTGGGGINKGFMEDGLIDEIILNVEPYLLGRGIKIFSEGNFESKLKLLGVKKLGHGLVQLRYRVMK